MNPYVDPCRDRHDPVEEGEWVVCRRCRKVLWRVNRPRR